MAPGRSSSRRVCAGPPRGGAERSIGKRVPPMRGSRRPRGRWARLGPMDFALSPEHEETRRTVRDFAEREVAPVADEMERAGEFPTEIVRRPAERGLSGGRLPGPSGGTDGPAAGRISPFIVEADAPGFSIGRMEDKMGLHASRTGELLFDDCRVPAANLLGEEGGGDRLFLQPLDGGRVGIGALAPATA